MSTHKHCPECDGTNVFVHGDISVKGGYGPDLLPGTSSLFTSARMKAVVCKDCGLIRFYATQETLAKVNTDRGWQRLL
jgi:predicted nucleic-acid-binding Zn-ribbon protein